MDTRLKFNVMVGMAALAVGGGLLYWYNHRRSRPEPKFESFSVENYFVLPDHVEVHVATLPEEVEPYVLLLLKDLMDSKYNVIGLDTEWKSTRGMSESPLALLQLSSKNQCVLIRLCNMLTLPNCVKQLLEDDQILKAGVGISNDIKLLWNQFHVLTRGCIDLQSIAHKYTTGGLGLKALSKNILDIELNKSHHIRCGNWEAETLNKTQISYGAIDAWVGQEILVRMYESKHVLDESMADFCRGAVDIVHTKAFTIKKEKTKKIEKKEENLLGSSQMVPKYTKVPKRQSVLYENCIMLSPGGEHLCSINMKKVNWYLSRDLAVLVQETPNVIIKLKHEPKGRGHAGSEYYLAVKENRCVVCSKDDSYARFSIVPHSYRKYLPMDVKGHSSHDIVLLCQECHRNASIASEALRRLIKKEDRVCHENQPLWVIDQSLKEVKSAACALRKYKDTLPSERTEQLKETLHKYFDKTDLTDEDLDIAAQVEFKSYKEIESHEERFVRTLTSQKDIEIFIKRWRKHFLDTMKPKYLPIGWNIEHPVLVDA